MFYAIAVDDESSALGRFERIASADSRISIEGKFLYAEDALAFVKEHSVDLAFLDIEMPEMSGLELAERLLEIDPYIKVIFVTAYNQYALDAYRAHAIGYLLKPLDSDEFNEQIELLSRYEQRPAKKPNQLLRVKCFGQLSVYADAENASIIRWKTAKAEELFALLIHFQGRAKSREILIDTLWPELEPEKSANLFRVTCTYLRAALAEKGFTDILLRESDGYRINTDLIDCDLYNLRLSARSVSTQELEALEASSALYSGGYLEGKPYDWALGTRAQLESEFKKIQYRLVDEYSARSLIDKALEVLDRTLIVDPCDEKAVMRIVNMQLRNGDHSAAVKTYRRYEKILVEELGISPSKRFPSEVSCHRKNG
jgi:Response regulator containing CheY-like receiver and SARP domains